MSLTRQVFLKGVSLTTSRLHAHVYAAGALLAWLGSSAATFHVVIPAYGLPGARSAIHSLKFCWHVPRSDPGLALLSFASTFLPFTLKPQTLGSSIPGAFAFIIVPTLVGEGLMQEVEHDLWVTHHTGE